MRINKFLALATGISRRAADRAITEGRVLVHGIQASTGHDVGKSDTVTYDGKAIKADDVVGRTAFTTVLLNKPAGYIVSRDGQGSATIYDLLPEKYHNLKPIGRLDKFSSGLQLLTDDGGLAQQLTHPKHRKAKIYEVKLSKPLAPLHRQMIQDHGIQIEDGLSKFQIERIHDDDDNLWQVTMREGRNRQIRRTFLSLGYGISTLHRTQFGDYRLDDLIQGKYKQV